ncbi:hypothetical protein EVAR_76909_1 [Eumeta japonica]|uniref:Uncharacterized protein n=1 Tax=Eumeta variegata TaxID=151549 RepID=A0A4C1SGY8_EUMVA|nr:hypothetical protein EVAR_76909_1 [Eumeta japonica]
METCSGRPPEGARDDSRRRSAAKCLHRGQICNSKRKRCRTIFHTLESPLSSVAYFNIGGPSLNKPLLIASTAYALTPSVVHLAVRQRFLPSCTLEITRGVDEATVKTDTHHPDLLAAVRISYECRIIMRSPQEVMTEESQDKHNPADLKRRPAQGQKARAAVDIAIEAVSTTSEIPAREFGRRVSGNERRARNA